MEIIKQIKVTNLTHDDLVNFLASMSTGITYWCSMLDFDERDQIEASKRCNLLLGEHNVCREDVWAEILLNNKPLKLYDTECDSDESPYILTKDKIEQAIAEVIKRDDWDGDDWGDVDDAVADEITQIALFDEVIYG